MKHASTDPTAGDRRAGLTAGEAARRRAEAGPNELPRGAAAPSIARRVLAQFASPVVLLPLAAAIVALATGERLDAAAILLVLLLNAFVGLRQEQNAAQAIRALQGLTRPRARVVRDGKPQVVAARDLVPGDLLEIEAGDIVAADGRLIDARALTLNEAMLTGESAAAAKTVDAELVPEAPQGSNGFHTLEAPPVKAGTSGTSGTSRVYMGTAVVTGTGRVIIEATGARTELGHIAGLLATVVDDETPLQRRLKALTSRLAALCGVVVLLVVGLGLWHGWTAVDLISASISLAVAAIPEGLPAVVTIALAIGVRRMALRRVLVRRLDAIETLGCTTVICTDKTGTLTTGVMAVQDSETDDEQQLWRAAAACCDASLDASQRSGVGDPGEVAILVKAASLGITRQEIERTNPRGHVVPFDAATRSMRITRADGRTYVKGAFDVLAAEAAGDRSRYEAGHARMTERGLRVLAVVVAPASGAARMVGLVGIADPLRPEAAPAVAAARRAGITTVMITGDHQATARAIARQLGIVEAAGDDGPAVHARARPADKLEVVRRWRERGAVVAMIGDGVNDAPALREADVGVAMNVTGTEVTREAADIVLADDNFASVVAAIREGRAVFENIRKTVVYLLTGNVAELMVMAVAALIGLPIPLLPLHLLWINLVTDGLPALALVSDPPTDDLMAVPPRDPRQALLGRAEWRAVAAIAVLESAVTLIAFWWASASIGVAPARGVAFSTLVYSEVFRALSARSTGRTFFALGASTNVRLTTVVAVSVALQWLLGVWPITARVFSIDHSAFWWAVALLFGLIPFTVMEIAKLVRARR